MIVVGILMLAIVGLMIVSLWKIFEKAGQPGWAAIIPIYNYYILTKISERPGYWTVLALIPYIGAIWAIWMCNRMVKRFGKTEGYTVGMVFLPFVFAPMLAFGDAQYKGDGMPEGGEGALDAGVFKS